MPSGTWTAPALSSLFFINLGQFNSLTERYHERVRKILGGLASISPEKVIRVSKSILGVILHELHSQSDHLSETSPVMISVSELTQKRDRFQSENIRVLTDRREVPRLFKELQKQLRPAEPLFSIHKTARVVLRDLGQEGGICSFEKPARQVGDPPGKPGGRLLPQRKFSLNSDFAMSRKPVRTGKALKAPREVSGFIENKGSIFGKVGPARRSEKTQFILQQFEESKGDFRRKGSTFELKAKRDSFRKYSEITERTPHFGSDGQKSSKKKKRRRKRNKKRKSVQHNIAEERESSQEDEDYFTRRILQMCRR